jgi:hypothetical protein
MKPIAIYGTFGSLVHGEFKLIEAKWIKFSLTRIK